VGGDSALIDGFIFQGGYADGQSTDDKSGGAIYTEGPLEVRNCMFRQNFAEKYGGALVAFDSGASSMRILNCAFEDNKTDERGGAVYTYRVSDMRIDSCSFFNNKSKFYGGGIYTNGTALVMADNVFTENVAGWSGGGVMYFTGPVYNLMASMQHNTFSKNQASFGGGTAVYANTNDNDLKILSSEFSENKSVRFFPGVASSGGAIGVTHQGNTPSSRNSILIQDCQILNNEAYFSGGGVVLYHQPGSGSGNEVTISQCNIFNNRANTESGGVSVISPHDAYKVIVDRSHFQNNYSPAGTGLGISRSDDNLAYSSKHEFWVTNCLFTDHSDPVKPNYVLGINNMKASVRNCTFADNQDASLGIKVKGGLTLQNNIFFRENGEELLLKSVTNPTHALISSSGGNLADDASLDQWLGAEDVSGTDPRFEENSYRLDFRSAAVDLGTLYPGFDPSNDKDLAGEDRKQGFEIDAGAYESRFYLSIKDDLVAPTGLKMYPIPVSSQATLELDNAWRGSLRIRVLNVLGQQVYHENATKNQAFTRLQLPLSHLRSGTYRLIVSDGAEAMVKSFVKQ
jgi:predicted outer membrane repeat protein